MRILFFAKNDKIFCEGKPILDAGGNFTFVPTVFKTETGATQNRIACQFSEKATANNYGSQNLQIPAEGSFVTGACRQGEDSPLRNCGFTSVPSLNNCAPGTEVKLFCKLASGESPAVVRVCEASTVLKVGMACTTLDALSNAVVPAFGVIVKFKCPTARDSLELGGSYALYTAPAHRGEKLPQVFCSLVESLDP